eukprot:scaffold60540_cov63-Cyclotella_meneghiniana.AAC.6
MKLFKVALLLGGFQLCGSVRPYSTIKHARAAAVPWGLLAVVFNPRQLITMAAAEPVVSRPGNEV